MYRGNAASFLPAIFSMICSKFSLKSDIKTTDKLSTSTAWLLPAAEEVSSVGAACDIGGLLMYDRVSLFVGDSRKSEISIVFY